MTAITQLSFAISFALAIASLVSYNTYQLYRVRKLLRRYQIRRRMKITEMRQYYMTRHDNIGASSNYDSIRWIYETHLHELDTNEYNYAMLSGPNEDAPIKIELWKDEPNWNTPADKVYNFA